MLKWKFLAVAVMAGTMVHSLLGLTPNLVISADMAALQNHPRVVKFREEFDTKAKEEGKKTSDEYLKEQKLTDEILSSRISFYADVNNFDGTTLFVIDTAEGKATEMFDAICETLKVKGEGTKSEISGCPTFSGMTEKGQPAMALLRSPSQIQIQLNGTDMLPVDFSKINKNLVLATKTKRIFNIAITPTPEMQSNMAALLPQLQALRMITIGINDTKPDSELLIEGTFLDSESAMAGKTMADMMLLVAPQQQQQLDPSLFQGFESSIDGGKVTYKRLLDQKFFDALTRTVNGEVAPEEESIEPAADNDKPAPRRQKRRQ